MQRILIPNGSEAVIADYRDQVVTDYKNNPFIEALPPIYSPQEVVKRLTYYPEYDSNERQLDKHYRIHLVNRLFKLFQPLPMTIELEKKISSALRQGYTSRNPYGRELAQGFCRDYGTINKTYNNEVSEINSSSYGFTLIGISGLGKTSSLDRILNMYPQIISHTEYNEAPFSAYQVVYLKLECPYDGSIKGLVLQFFSEIDRLLGTNYYEKMIRARATTDTLMTVMNQVVRNCSLGLLVIDEIQNLSMAKSGGSEKMLNLFVNLINYVNVPLVLVGTPGAISILQGDFRHARRGVGPCGDMICDRIGQGAIWDLLVDAVWHYQWTKSSIPLTQDIRKVLYEETQGIPDLLMKLYSVTQMHVISSGNEEITVNTIRKVARENLKLVQPMVKALKTNNIREIAKYNDINLLDAGFDELIRKTKENTYINMRTEPINNDNITKVNEYKNESNTRKVSQEKPKSQEIDAEDIRYIVEKAKKLGASAYKALKETSYIVTYDKDVFNMG